MVDNRQYIDKIKLIFLHIPKTGGSFLEKKLQLLAKKKFGNTRFFGGHYSLNMYETNKFSDYKIFTIVRNPFDRIFSCYNYLVQKKWYINKFPNTFKKLKRPGNFNEFVDNLYELYKSKSLPWLQEEDIKLTSRLYNLKSTSNIFLLHIYPQYLFLSKQYSNKNIKVLKYENLDSELKKFNLNFSSYPHIFEELNHILKYIKIKPSYNIPLKYPNLIDKIKEIYKLDFEIFKYKL